MCVRPLSLMINVRLYKNESLTVLHLGVREFGPSSRPDARRAAQMRAEEGSSPEPLLRLRVSATGLCGASGAASSA